MRRIRTANLSIKVECSTLELSFPIPIVEHGVGSAARAREATNPCETMKTGRAL